jgi:hypothetical protein
VLPERTPVIAARKERADAGDDDFWQDCLALRNSKLCAACASSGEASAISDNRKAAQAVKA